MGVIQAWRGRTRTLRGSELREYDAFWADWHAKYDRYQSRDGKHKLNSVSRGSLLCTCGVRFHDAAEGELLEVFEEHLDENKPQTIDVGALLAARAEGRNV